jgi:hypothetical protein
MSLHKTYFAALQIVLACDFRVTLSQARRNGEAGAEVLSRVGGSTEPTKYLAFQCPAKHFSRPEDHLA